MGALALTESEKGQEQGKGMRQYPPSLLLRLLPAGAVLLLLCGCHALRLAPTPAEKQEKSDRAAALTLPGKRSLRLGQYVFLADFEIKADQPLFRELTELRAQVYHGLELSEASPLIQVYLFEDRERYERFIRARYPDLPRRRAFFVAQPHSVGGAEDLLVYTFWGDRIREDLRHELTHALLHSVLRDVPLWLDEGLAEYFELLPESQEASQRHLEQIRLAGGTARKPDLPHLEELKEVQQMTPAEYREAWAWVHLILQGNPEARSALIAYLQQLRTNANAGPLYPRLAAVFPDLQDAFNRHLEVLDQDRHPALPATDRAGGHLPGD
jgi:hypothetical protein